MIQFYATCASGLAPLLADELTSIGLNGVRRAGAGASFTGTVEDAYRACLWSRLANRVLLPLHRVAAETPESLYAGVREVDWSAHLRASNTIAVDFFSAHSSITHTQFGAQKVKDGIVDQFREASGDRPNVDRDRPDIRVNVYVFKNEARIALDLSGDSLHRRGYRREGGRAPLKENLAAGLLMLAEWPRRLQEGEAFVDPMCGSGTLAIEAALIAGNIPPAWSRDYFGFTAWLEHDQSQWEKLRNEAEAARRPIDVEIVASDQSPTVLEECRLNVSHADLGESIDIQQHDVLKRGIDKSASSKGLLLTNPPYGERLQTDDHFYASLGPALSRHYGGWSCHVFTADSAPWRQMSLQLNPVLEIKNGGIDCLLLGGDIPSTRAPQGTPIDVTAFSNRVKKNARSLKGWVKQSNVQAYRLYDADLPDFSVAIDIYNADDKHCLVQEYKAPRTVNIAVAADRLAGVMDCLPALLDIPPQNVHLRLRERQGGTAQYTKSDSTQSVVSTVEEYGARYEVNFTDYLDTGLFLDHRPVRRHIQQSIKGGRFLNLFAYTATATVAAVLGGACSSVSVDLSKTYCDWAKRNLDHNNADPECHQVVRQDVMGWLDSDAAKNHEPFDMILLDPPTFSNSSSVEKDWNVQEHHVDAIRACLDLLAPGGVLIFSNNFRKFKLDEAELMATAQNPGDIEIEDRSRWSIDKDFQRNSRVHQCWFVMKNPRPRSLKTG